MPESNGNGNNGNAGPYAGDIGQESPQMLQPTIAQVLSPLQFSGDFLYYALVFFVLALVAYALGAQGIAGLSMDIAKILVVVFLVLAVVALLL